MTDTPETPEGAAPAPAPATEASAPAAAKLDTAGTEAGKAAENAGGFVSRNWSKVKDNFKYVEGNKAMVFARGAGVAAGVGMTLDSFRSKNSAGEDRGFGMRAVEGAAGLLLAGASARAGGR